ncbi:MAG TPA: phage holin family protein [Gaiellaceae bacterium]|jgi:hypothetical protein|nr:phage holin family protein [Gaiellaceae bacterium]
MLQEVDEAGERKVAPGRLRAAARAVRHVQRIALLERELAGTELRRKGARAGAAAATAAGAAALAPFAVGLALAAIVTALALAVALWLALLIALALVLAVVAALVLLSRRLAGGSRPFRPERALEEARLLREAVRRGNGT